MYGMLFSTEKRIESDVVGFAKVKDIDDLYKMVTPSSVSVTTAKITAAQERSISIAKIADKAMFAKIKDTYAEQITPADVAKEIKDARDVVLDIEELIE